MGEIGHRLIKQSRDEVEVHFRVNINKNTQKTTTKDEGKWANIQRRMNTDKVMKKTKGGTQI